MLKTNQQADVHNLETTLPENNVEFSLPETRQQEVKKLANKFAKNSTASSEESVPFINKLNKNNLNENNLSNQSISKNSSDGQSDEIDKIDTYTKYRELIYGNIEYEIITEGNPSDREQIDEIVENMLEMLCSTSPAIRISGNDIPAELVKNRILKIHSGHIEYMLFSLQRNRTKVRNIKAYLRSVIYNAPSTMESFYKAEVNHDLYGQDEN